MEAMFGNTSAFRSQLVMVKQLNEDFMQCAFVPCLAQFWSFTKVLYAFYALITNISSIFNI